MTQQPRTPTTETLSPDQVQIIRDQAAIGDGAYYHFGARHDILALLATLDQQRADLLAQIEKAVLAIPEHKPPMRNGRRVRDGFSVGFAAGVRTGRETAVLAIRAIRSAAPVEPTE